MAFSINRGNAFTSTNVPDCAPVTCAVCGGLECLCRPRFFAGQLLTDEDLQRLDHYITAKNKLHNRYLVGWGVACGLEVVCNACDGTVTVRSGYALSPCGEDIVVCADASVDVCSMIQKCRKTMPRDCQPTQVGGVDPCSETTENWVLAICYDEKPSRGVVPLKNTGSATCCSRCASGGSGSCGCGGQSSSGGCGCGGKSTGKSNGKSSSCSCGSASQTSQSSSTQVQCQPTIVCEGYHFEVCKLSANQNKTRNMGALVQRFYCCLLKLGELFSQFPTSNNQQDVKTWCCSIREALLEFSADNPGYDCGLAQRLAKICQSNDPQQIGNDVGRLVLEYFEYCFCSALLPPCPPPATDDCVPLATVTVSRKGGGCTIQRVCNIEARKFLVDLPNLGYWLSWIPFGDGLRQIFARICCQEASWETTAFRASNQAESFTTARAAAGPAAAVATTTPAADFMGLILESVRNRENKVDMQALTMAMLGMTDLKSNHTMSPLDLKYPFESLFVNQVGVPLVQSYLGGLGRIGGGTFTASGQAATATPASAPPAQPVQPAPAAQTATHTDAQVQIDALKKQMDAMKAELHHSQLQIDKLSKRKKNT
jgi:hypothetical protein